MHVRVQTHAHEKQTKNTTQCIDRTQTIDEKQHPTTTTTNKQKRIQRNLTSISAHIHSWFIKIDKHIHIVYEWILATWCAVC